MKNTITLRQTTQKMIESLEEAARDSGVKLNGITTENFNNFLDDLFNDGGQARCERFADLGIEYALQFGQFDGDQFHIAQWRTINGALKRLERKYPPNED